MTKTVYPGQQTQLNNISTTLCTCWKIVRTDGVVFTFTTADIALTLLDGYTYTPNAGFTSTALENKSDFTVDNVDINGIFDSESITIQDLRAGLFDYADVYIYVVDWARIGIGEIITRRGKLGEVIASPQGWFQAELRGMNQLLQQQIIQLFGPECRNDLGDARCTVPIDPPLWTPLTQFTAVANGVNIGGYCKAAVSGSPNYAQYGNIIFKCIASGVSGKYAPTWNTTIGGLTYDNDGEGDPAVTWETVEAWTHDGVVASVIDSTHFTVTFTAEDSRDVDQWYQYGILKFDTGNNAGRALEVKNWVKANKEVTLYVPAGYPVQVGDAFRMTPGCDKSYTTCRNKFNNILNLNAEPYLPGNDYAFYYPSPNGVQNQTPG